MTVTQVLGEEVLDEAGIDRLLAGSAGVEL
jgi:hypothetical protein